VLVKRNKQTYKREPVELSIQLNVSFFRSSQV